MVRRILRPFPGSNGEAFYKKDGAKSDRDILDPKNLNGRQSHMNEEFMNRPGRALSMTAASICEMATYVDMYVTADSSSALGPTGLPGFQTFLTTPKGKKFWDAARYLNVSMTGPSRTPADTGKAITTIFEIANDDDLFPVNAMQRLANFSAKMFTGSIKMIELIALIRGDRQHWANELQCQLRQLPTQMKDFVNDPVDDQALLDAMVACYHDQVVPEAEGTMTGGFLDNGARSSASHQGARVDEDREVRSSKRVSLFGPRGGSSNAAVEPPASKRSKVFEASIPETPTVEETPVGGGTVTPMPEFELEDWPLLDIVAWKENASITQTKNEFASLARKTQQDVLSAIPCSVLKEYDMTSIEISEGNVEIIAKQLTHMIKDLQLAWLTKTEAFDNAKHGWRLCDDLFHGKLLPKCSGNAVYFETEEKQKEIEALIEDLVKEDDQIDKKSIKAKLEAEEEDLLRRASDERMTATAFFSCVKFVREHTQKEPNAKAISNLLQTVPEVLREMCDVTSIDKYAKIKARTWRDDVSKVLTIAFRVYDAWLPKLDD